MHRLGFGVAPKLFFCAGMRNEKITKTQQQAHIAACTKDSDSKTPSRSFSTTDQLENTSVLAFYLEKRFGEWRVFLNFAKSQEKRLKNSQDRSLAIIRKRLRAGYYNTSILVHRSACSFAGTRRYSC